MYAVYTDGSEKPLSASEYTVDRGGFAADQAGEYVFTVTYGTAEPQSFTVKVLEKSGCGSALSAGSAVGPHGLPGAYPGRIPALGGFL